MSLLLLPNAGVGGGGGGLLPENLSGGMRPPADFAYPISDLSQNSIPYFRPDPYPISFALRFDNFFKFRTIIKSDLLEEENSEKVASSKNRTHFQIRVHIPYPISDQNGQNLYPISDQTDSKTIPLGAAHP